MLFMILLKFLVKSRGSLLREVMPILTWSWDKCIEGILSWYFLYKGFRYVLEVIVKVIFNNLAKNIDLKVFIYLFGRFWSLSGFVVWVKNANSRTNVAEWVKFIKPYARKTVFSPWSIAEGSLRFLPYYLKLLLVKLNEFI